MKKILLGLLLITTVLSCKDATKAQFDALGKEHVIVQYGCDGHIINRWCSTGNVSNEGNSDGWYFEDSASRKLVEVTGMLVITVK
jgi:hypothetical protein